MTHSLRFADRLTYSAAPEIVATIRIADYEADVLLLVDTGAERTLLDGVHARAAGLDIFQGRPRAFQGFLGARTIAHEHLVRVRIGSSEIESDLAFSTQPLLRQVLGRDLLEHLLVGLNHRARELYLARRR